MAHAYGQLEKAFQTDFSRLYNRYIRLVMTVATLIYLFSGLIDYVILGAHVASVWEVRFYVGAPILLIINAYAFTSNFWRFQQQMLLLYVLVMSFCLFLMSAIALEVAAPIYFTALVVTQLAGLSVLRLQFRYAVVGAGAIMLMGAGVHWVFAYPLQRAVVDAYFLFGVSVISLLAAYNLERFTRQDYVQKQLLRREQAQLQVANEHLQDLVTNDALTTIANRRYFDTVIHDEWRRAQRGHYPLALLLIDIDHFKDFNDYYGDHKGDDVLRSVAKTLAGFGKRAGDMVARYGGGEFAIVSAGTAYEDAVSLGQRLCKAIANLHIPHENAPAHNTVTVSVGVASIVPLLEQNVSTLLNDANKNLEQAKANGRNCAFGAQSTMGRVD
ncbi:MAG: diguanylate cyclase [Gammaproteobacteria bacterium]